MIKKLLKETAHILLAILVFYILALIFAQLLLPIGAFLVTLFA